MGFGEINEGTAAMIEKTTRREEDYRDYEERDIGEGWPYADGVSGSETKVANAGYGETEESFDESGNPGFQAGDETARFGKGGPNILTDDPESDTNDDAIEEAINNALEEHEIDASGVEIKVRKGVAELTGFVETGEERRMVEELVYRMAGISSVRNGLTTQAVDAGIPSDWND